MNTTTRASIAREIYLRLGGQMIDVEIDPEHYELAIDKALEKYRQRSENAVEEKFIDLELAVDQNTYQLTEDVIEIKDIYQSATGGTLNQGVEFEPFGAQYINTYLGPLASGQGGSLATYDFLQQKLELVGLLFGYEFQFTWNRSRKQLILQRRPRSAITVYLHAYAYRDEADLFTDYSCRGWIKDYALAQSKLMLGEARGKFATIAGPQGGTTLNGDQLKADALNELIQLEEDLKLYKDGAAGLGIIIG
jgi:hypothetical protein